MLWCTNLCPLGLKPSFNPIKKKNFFYVETLYTYSAPYTKYSEVHVCLPTQNKEMLCFLCFFLFCAGRHTCTSLYTCESHYINSFQKFDHFINGDFAISGVAVTHVKTLPMSVFWSLQLPFNPTLIFRTKTSAWKFSTCRLDTNHQMVPELDRKWCILSVTA